MLHLPLIHLLLLHSTTLLLAAQHKHSSTLPPTMFLVLVGLFLFTSFFPPSHWYKLVYSSTICSSEIAINPFSVCHSYQCFWFVHTFLCSSFLLMFLDVGHFALCSHSRLHVFVLRPTLPFLLRSRYIPISPLFCDLGQAEECSPSPENTDSLLVRKLFFFVLISTDKQPSAPPTLSVPVRPNMST